MECMVTVWENKINKTKAKLKKKKIRKYQVGANIDGTVHSL